MLRLPLLALCASFGVASFVSAHPVEFTFRPEPLGDNPFAREVWAEVRRPDGAVVLQPAFYRADGLWSVRARAAQSGEYALGSITESSAGRVVTLKVERVSPATFAVASPDPLGGPIRIDPRRPRHFVHADGSVYYPLGANFPWPSREGQRPDDYYPVAFAHAAEVGLNWARVWMAHWAHLNLDWLPVTQGPSPAPGWLDLQVADGWDRLIQTAEQHGLRLQVVLQHHGQYSTRVNSDWGINPWNQRNGGFLAEPAEFFTSPRAREYTRRKYRYIVARWGYSAAVLAWELFNEAKWTDARYGDAPANAAVADWHAEMARYIRSLDTERHLITTSDDSLSHPLYAAMDFLQPHLYANNMLAGVRRFDLAPEALDRPIFYGEVGDDNLRAVSVPLRLSGGANLALAWAGLMGSGAQPAQLWYAYRLADSGRFGELRALTAFVRAAGLDQPEPWTAFSPAVDSSQRMPLAIEPGAHWHRMRPPTVIVPTDGSVPAELAAIPNALIWQDDPKQGLEPFPHAMTLVLDYPRDATAILRFPDADPRGASIRLTLNGKNVGEYVWPEIPPEDREGAAPRPREFVLPMRPGRHTLVLDNPKGPEWVLFGSLATGLEVPMIAAVGRRTPERIVLWVYHRAGVFSDQAMREAEATILLEDVSPGQWRLTWWDVTRGTPSKSLELKHPGGTLEVMSPPVSRHTAAWMERLKD